MPRPTRSRLIACSVAALFVAAACSDDAEPEATSDPAEFAAQELESDEPDVDEADPTTAPPESDTLATDIPGAILNKYQLQLGDCFEQIDVIRQGRADTVFSRFPCDEPHGYEIFATHSYPAEHPSVFPGDTVVRDYAVQLCYRDFADFVGEDYEVSALEIDVIIPTRTNFEDNRSRYRGIHCWVERVDGEPMVGSARGTGW
ncbi:MAG: hypothetical protein AAF548_08575 [Actinomycetota bacterium]